MTTLTEVYRILIHTRPEKAFAYVADLSRHGEWSGGRLRVEPLAKGPVAVGSQYHSLGDLPGQKDRANELRVSEYQPPSRFGFIAQDPTFGNVIHAFSFTPQADGTLVERRVTTEMSPGMALLSRIMIKPLIARPMMNKAMAALKAQLEQGGV